MLIFSFPKFSAGKNFLFFNLDLKTSRLKSQKEIRINNNMPDQSEHSEQEAEILDDQTQIEKQTLLPNATEENGQVKEKADKTPLFLGLIPYKHKKYPLICQHFCVSLFNFARVAFFKNQKLKKCHLCGLLGCFR